MKRDFGTLSLTDALQLVPTDELKAWSPPATPHAPSATITDYLRRLRAFDLQNTEAAKLLLIDALLAEVVPNHPRLKVWKAMPLESDVLMGVADYLISPPYAYLKAPLLCAVEAKRDDFVQGRAQCVAEMTACRYLHEQAARVLDVYGIVSNGQAWQFYRLEASKPSLHETEMFTMNNLPELLGVLDHVCAACAAS